MPCFAMEREMEVIMSQIFSYIIFGIMAIMGGGTSLFFGHLITYGDHMENIPKDQIRL